MSYEPRATSHEPRTGEFPDYPFKCNYLSVNGHQMHYLDEGARNGRPLVMVHGNPTWSYFFRKPVLALREDYRCIVPDHIGMGLSAKPSPGEYGFSLTERVADLESLMEQLDLQNPATLLLHDWGGMIGMAYACRHPDRIASLIILNTAAFTMPAGSMLPWQLKIARGPLGPLLIQGFNVFCKSAITRCVTRDPMEPGVRQAYLAPYDSWNNRRAVLRFVQDIPLTPDSPSYPVLAAVEHQLGQFIHTPMLVCWGMRDFVFNAIYLEQWRKRFSGAEFHVFEDAGHYLLEDAADEVIPIIERFLKQSVKI